MQARRVVPAAVATATILLLAAAFVPGRWGEWVFVLGAPLVPVLLIALAVERRGSTALLLRGTVLALGILLTLSSITIRLLDAGPGPRWLLGLPASAVVMGLGLVVLPLLLVGLGFAATFDASPPAAERSTRPEAGAPDGGR